MHSIKAQQMLSNCGHLVLCYVRIHTNLTEQCWVKRGGNFPAFECQIKQYYLYHIAGHVYFMYFYLEESECGLILRQ